MKNETRLKILKISCIYGGVLSLFLVGLYVFLVVAVIFHGTMRHMSIQIILLLTGIVVATVFSYIHLDYAKGEPEKFTCPILPGITITVICLTPGLIFIPALVSRSSNEGISCVVAGFMYFIPFYISLILGILSAYAVLSGSRKSPEDISRWKARGLQLSTVILMTGIVVSGISLSSGSIGDARMVYGLTIDTSEETTLLVPLPVDESNNVIVGFMDGLEVIEGDAVWDIVGTTHGTALEVRTSTGCVLSAQQEYGKKGRDEGREWVYSYNLSTLSGVDMAAYETWVFSSNANTTLYMILSMDNGLGVVLSYSCDDTPLSVGWQTRSVDTQQTHETFAMVPL